MLLGDKAVVDEDAAKGPGLNLLSLILFQVGLTPKLVQAKQHLKPFLSWCKCRFVFGWL